IGEDLGQDAPFRAHARFELAALCAHPAAVPALLVLPLARVTNPGLRLDIVEPSVFDALAIGPNVLAGHRAGVTPDAFVEVQRHADLSTHFHLTGPPSRRAP